MNRRLTKPYEKNVRLDKPCGLIGVPPDAPYLGAASNVVIIARLTDRQCDALVNALLPVTGKQPGQ